MPQNHPICPKCNSTHAYPDGALWTCPECFHEWNPEAGATPAADLEEATAKFLDSNGVQLQDGDTVVTIKDLKVGKDTLKSGTKVKGIRLLDEPVNGHDISCKVGEFGSIYLKCSVVKKAN
ncbi:MAG: alkylphosphonate utilization protein [Bdellovibrionales bacterium]|nr:alkylphosphonate utilization protein [Bdellovibrionales bacterium]